MDREHRNVVHKINYNLRPNAETARIGAKRRQQVVVTHTDNTNPTNPPGNSNSSDIKPLFVTWRELQQ